MEDIIGNKYYFEHLFQFKLKYIYIYIYFYPGSLVCIDLAFVVKNIIINED